MAKKQDGFVNQTEAGKKFIEARKGEPTAAEKLQSEIELKADELTKQYGVKVHAFLFYDPADTEKKDPVIGYVKEPGLEVKIRVLDKGAALGEFAASLEMLGMCILRDVSDRRTCPPQIVNGQPEPYDPANDKYVLGACLKAQQMIEIALSQFKKK